MIGHMNSSITVADGSKMSGFSAEHVRFLCRTGALAATQYGPTWVIEADSVTAYLALDRRRGPKINKKRRAALEAKANEL